MLLERSFDGSHARRGLRTGIYQVPSTYSYISHVHIICIDSPCQLARIRFWLPRVLVLLMRDDAIVGETNLTGRVEGFMLA